MRGPLLCVAAAAASLVLVSCVGRPPERPRAPMLGPPVELHVLLPLCGADADSGLRTWDVVGLATQRLNESRGPLDRPLQATIHDSGSTSDRTRAAAEGLVGAGILAFVGPAGPAGVLGLQNLLDDPGVLVVLPDATDLPTAFGGSSTVAVLAPGAASTLVWTDPRLPEPTLWGHSWRETAATYDAVIALGRAVRRAPGTPPAELRALLVTEAWEGMLGPTRFVRVRPDGPWFGHPPGVP